MMFLTAGIGLRRVKGTAMAASLKLIDSERTTGNMDREKALEAALAQIDRAFGKGSAMKLGQREAMEIEAVSTGSLGLDIALGIGGLPKGRVIEIFGPESSGKTTLALHAIAEAQKLGGTAAFIDAEHALDRASITCNKNGIPFDPEKPFVTSGLRLGTPAGTTRGFGPAEFRQIGRMIADVVEGLRKNGEAGDGQIEARIKDEAEALCARFPIYPS